MYSVYRYTFPDGKIYVGVTKNTVQYRKDCGYQHNKPLTDAIRTAGFKNVSVDILCKTQDETEAFEKERQFITALKSCNPTIGYNISSGGKATFEGRTHMELSKKKMSDSHKGKVFSDGHREKLRLANIGKHDGEKNAMYGKPKSKECIEKQYISHKKEMKTVIQMDLDGNVIAEYDSMHRAEKATGVARNCIKACAIGKQRSSKGFMWKYKDGDYR